jgi:phosphoribosylamine--glycine ligase
MATKGYPGSFANGSVISNLEQASNQHNIHLFHAGTITGPKGEIVANGGRVLGITATGKTVLEAKKTAYEAVDAIHWPEGFCRRDIGWRAVEREKKKI